MPQYTDGTIPGLPPDGLDPIDSADVKPARQDRRNALDNLERVDLPAGTTADTGTWKIRVRGAAVFFGPQDFSLVADFPLSFAGDTVYADSLAFVQDFGISNRGLTALRESDSTLFFTGGTGRDTVYAFGLNQGIKWWHAVSSENIHFLDPVVSGEFVFLRAAGFLADSLIMLRDMGGSAVRLWSTPIAFPPSTDTSGLQSGDTSVVNHAYSGPVPAVDPVNRLIYASSQYENVVRVRIIQFVVNGDTAYFDSTITSARITKLWIFGFDGSVIKVDSVVNANINLPPAASPDGGFFIDDQGNLYRLSPSTFTSIFASVLSVVDGQGPPVITRPPILGPNGWVYVYGYIPDFDHGAAAAINAKTVQREYAFATAGTIASNMVIDANGSLAWASKFPGGSPDGASQLVLASPSGYPYALIPLSQSLATVGDLTLGDDGLVYLNADNRLLGFDMVTGDRELDIPAPPPGIESPHIIHRLMIQFSDNKAFGFRVTSTGLSSGWARTGRDNGGTGFMPHSVGFIAGGVGDGTVTDASWNDSNTVYTLCGKGGGIGGTQDNLVFSSAFLGGDFEVSAKVQFLDATRPDARAGLMAVSDSGATTEISNNAKNGFVWVASSNWAGFSHRDATGGATAMHAALGNFSPVSTWLRLRRQGGILSAFVSQNGLHYTKTGEMDIGTGTLFVGPTHTSASASVGGCADFGEIALGAPSPKALLVVDGSPSAPAADSAVKAHLESLGFSVTVKHGAEVSMTDANHKEVIVLSSTVNSKTVGTKFRGVAVPVLGWEPLLLEKLGVVAGNWNTDVGRTLGSQIRIVNPGHPLAAGLTAGNHTVASVSDSLLWVKPNPHMSKIATLTGDTAKTVLFGYEQGTAMRDMRAPARRVGLFLGDFMAGNLTAKGHDLLDAAILWATAPVAPSALFAVGNTSLNIADQALRDTLEGRGYSLTVKAASSTTTADAHGKNLVFISSSVASVDIRSKFARVEVPVLGAEPALFDDLGMTGGGSNQGITLSQTQVKILDASHPMGARLTGFQTVSAAADTFAWGKPATGALSAASLASDTGKKAIFGYERGTAMISGLAPARRVGVQAFGANAYYWTAAGGGLFDASLAFTTGAALPKALFVVGSVALNPSDSAIAARLKDLGYALTIKSGSAAATADAAGKDAVIISSTTLSTDVGTKFRNVATPVLNWEQALQDDLGMTGGAEGTDRGTQSSQSQIAIAAPDHPMSIGFTGTLGILTSAGTLSWGKPNGNANKVATVAGNGNRTVLYGYERGAYMVGLAAPGRRVGFFLEDNEAVLLNTAGWNLFEAALRWAAAPFDCAGPCGLSTPFAPEENAVLNTTGERWYVVEGSIDDWQASEMAGRTIQVNGVTVTAGQMPLPPSVNGKYFFRFSAGQNTWASWGYWSYPASPSAFGDKTFELRFLHSGRCLDALGTSPGSNAGQWSCHGGDNQRWRFTHKGSEYYEVVDVRDNLCLESAGGGTANGTNIQLGTCSGAQSQLFRPVAAPGEVYRLLHKQSGKLADVEGASEQNGANVFLWQDNGGDNQKLLFNQQ